MKILLLILLAILPLGFLYPRKRSAIVIEVPRAYNIIYKPLRGDYERLMGQAWYAGQVMILFTKGDSFCTRLDTGLHELFHLNNRYGTEAQAYAYAPMMAKKLNCYHPSGRNYQLTKGL